MERSPADHFESIQQQKRAAHLGMWLFLTSEVLLFGALFGVYSGYRVEYPSDFARASAHNNVWLGTGNTLVLLTSSLLAAAAVHAARSGRQRATVGFLIGTLLLARWLVTSKFGRVLAAIRDAEARVMFCGYDTLWYKLFVWTLSAVLCGIAGALYVPQVGIINPSEMSPANSIEIAIWAAVGGRGTLVGPIIGAGLVNGAKSVFTVKAPESWLFVLGATFVGVTLLAPQGIAGLFAGLRRPPRERAPAESPLPEKT